MHWIQLFSVTGAIFSTITIQLKQMSKCFSHFYHSTFKFLEEMSIPIVFHKQARIKCIYFRSTYNEYRANLLFCIENKSILAGKMQLLPSRLHSEELLPLRFKFHRNHKFSQCFICIAFKLLVIMDQRFLQVKLFFRQNLL